MPATPVTRHDALERCLRLCVCICVCMCVRMDVPSSEDASLGFVRSCGSASNKPPHLSLCILSTSAERRSRGAVATHGTTRECSGTPCSTLHDRYTERSLVCSVAFAALVYLGLVARSPKSCTCASTEIGANLQITTTPHSCRPCYTRAAAHSLPTAAFSAFYSAGLARYRRCHHLSSCFRPVMER